MSIVQPFLLCVLALNLGFAFWRLFHRDHLARFFLLAFGPFYIGVSWRFLQNNGWIEHGFWGNHAYQIGAFVHMLVMSAGVLTLYTRMRQEKEKVEYRLHSENLLRRQQADFLGMVSHEFRTPLSIIASTSENLLIDRDLTSAARLRVDKIIRANKRLYALMDEYLSHERLMTGTAKQEYQAIDLALLARRVHSELVDAEGPPIAMQVDAPVQVIGDAELLRVAIQNLVTNARRHSPPGSAIRVRVSQQMDQAELLVEDEGSGVPEHERPHIFDKFYRGGNTMDKPGAGMGLYLVKSIVEQHQGSIEQRNLSPQGCQFIIRIPLRSQFHTL